MIGKKAASSVPAAADDLVRARLRAADLPAGAVWRSLDELSRTPQFCEAVEREFPSSVMDFPDDFSRRNFLRLMGASMALAGIYGCSERPSERILPYVNPPEQVVPGMPISRWLKPGFVRGARRRYDAAQTAPNDRFFRPDSTS
jgi:molybdopterin-containing oxidoreductase family iron-sulfur binding subunit